MDALALLCTLHAEGPRTLRLLREAGCRDVREFLALDAEVVAALLDVPPAVARRLGREGRHLAGRVGAGFLEPEDGEAVAIESTGDPIGIPGGVPAGVSEDHNPRKADGPIATVRSSVAPPVEARASAQPLATPAPAPKPALGKYLSRAERQILDKVMERWAEGDSPESAPGEPTVAEAQVQPETPPAEPIPTPRLEIAGVPLASIQALEAAGFSTAPAVADANTMALAGAVDCSFGDARRFQFLAARATPEVPEREVPDSIAPRTTDAKVHDEPHIAPIISERLIERPSTDVPAPKPVLSVRPQFDLLPPVAREPAQPSEPAHAADPAPADEALVSEASKTVLNWDFVERGSQEGATETTDRAPEAGGPFA